MVYNVLSRHPGLDAVLIERRIGKMQLVRGRLHRLGWRTVVGQLAFVAGFVPLLRLVGARRITELKQELKLDDTSIPEDQVTRVSSANAAETVQHLRALAPKVVVLNGTRILSPEVLASVQAVFLNMHVGITPLYRGVHGGYWALVNGQHEYCGVTVHMVNEGIDTGGIVAQARISPGPNDTFATYQYLQVAAGLPLLQHAVEDALAGVLTTRPGPPGQSRLWSHPTAFEYLRHRIQRGVK
jgi:folate-dependent phosphoribosylglycinamide formyltransferase PurN